MGHLNPPMLLGTLGTIEAALSAIGRTDGGVWRGRRGGHGDRHRDAMSDVTAMRYADLLARIDAGEVVVIDGGTGTEIQRRGVAMDGDTWCAEANIGAPDTVRDVHASYIDAGAELIIANTYATSPLLFDHLGRSDDVERIDRIAVALAQQAPRPGAGRRFDLGHAAGRRRRRSQRRVPQLDQGPRPRDVPAQGRDDGRRRCRRVGDGDDARHRLLRVGDRGGHRDRPPGAGSGSPSSAAPTAALVGPADRTVHSKRSSTRSPRCGPDLIAIMHSSPNDTGPALDVVRSRTDIRLGAYPESGFFEMPDWRFVDIIGVDDLVARTRGWIEQGAHVVGGCCGISPDHIAALAAALAAITS